MFLLMFRYNFSISFSCYELLLISIFFRFKELKKEGYWFVEVNILSFVISLLFSSRLSFFSLSLPYPFFNLPFPSILFYSFLDLSFHLFPFLLILSIFFLFFIFYSQPFSLFHLPLIFYLLYFLNSPTSFLSLSFVHLSLFSFPPSLISSFSFPSPSHLFPMLSYFLLFLLVPFAFFLFLFPKCSCSLYFCIFIFNDIKILDKLQFYAPWCGHCKNLEPIWEEVDLELKQTSSIVTAKLDCTKYRGTIQR